MASIEEIFRLSPLPVVEITSTEPRDGWQLSLSPTCRKNLGQGVCEQHYRSLEKAPLSQQTVPCPFGFTSVIGPVGHTRVAFTGIIPYPRSGGKMEPVMAKRHPEQKVSLASVLPLFERLRGVEESLMALEDQTVRNYSMALHEIRKLNRTIVQNAERICLQESPKNPDKASVGIVNIFKAAEIMSRQFDIMALLANEGLATLPLNTTIEPYRIFDKCVRVYNDITPKRIRIQGPSYFLPRVKASDLTFPIIPTVLIENAIKYAADDAEILIRLSHVPDKNECLIEVSNETEDSKILDASVFDRGVRASSDRDGTGSGLYLAQLVARQHGSKIAVTNQKVGPTRYKHTFSLTLRPINAPQ